MCFGYLNSDAWLRLVEPLMTSIMVTGLMPTVFATLRISAAAARLVADSRLFRALAAWPVPAGPTCTTVLPIRFSSALARSTAAASPPTMMVSSPVIALGTPPETGASR